MVDDADPGGEIPDLVPDGARRDIYCRHEDPFQPQRVDAVENAVSVGDTLSAEQQAKVRALVREFADCFALSVGEVCAVPGASHHLDVPAETEFSKKVHQKRLTPPQKAYLDNKIDELLAAGVIEACDPKDVKCVSPITL